MTIEYVDVLTAGGVITVDVTSSHDNGLLDLDADYSGVDVPAAVLRAINSGNGLTDDKGNFVVINLGAVLALTYYHAPSKLLTGPKSHSKVLHGRCPVCGHYGDDCEGSDA